VTDKPIGKAHGSAGCVNLLVLTGEIEEAKDWVSLHHPGQRCVVLSKRELRESGWRGQIKAFRKLKGDALIFFARSLSELPEPQLLAWSALLHSCRLTVLADSSGAVIEYRRIDLLFLFPRTIVSALRDALVFFISWFLIRTFRWRARPIPVQPQAHVDLDLAYLYPFPLDASIAGGALSHVSGVLAGIAACGASCEIVSGRTLPPQPFPVSVVPANKRFTLFRESLLLLYNVRFVMAARTKLHGRRVSALYQRHGRFVVSGALLSRWLRVPLILEYNGSEKWMAKHWDPARYLSWLGPCEDASLSRAHVIVVVSEPLKQQLLDRGVQETQILLNPNAVDPDVFRPGCGGSEIRQKLGFTDEDVVVAFVGTFDYWHGTPVMEQAILRLFAEEKTDTFISRLRFLLVGEGGLSNEIRRGLHRYRSDRVRFTGLVSHASVPAHLDSADILLSPHVPMPDGSPFFGSPTKLFEYMAMAKGIVASNLDQLSRVLQHGHSGWMIEPGNAAELASAVLLLAKNPHLRRRLGENARCAALAEHTWKQNAARVLARVQSPSTKPALVVQ